MCSSAECEWIGIETLRASAGAPGSLKAKDSHTLNDGYMQRFEEGFAALGGSQPQPKYGLVKTPKLPSVSSNTG